MEKIISCTITLDFDDFTAFVNFWQSGMSKSSIWWYQNKDKSSLNGRSWLPHSLLLYSKYFFHVIGESSLNMTRGRGGGGY